MDDELFDSEDELLKISDSSTKRKKSYGRVKDVAKKLKASTHETGPDCKCTRLACFTKVTLEERKN